MAIFQVVGGNGAGEKPASQHIWAAFQLSYFGGWRRFLLSIFTPWLPAMAPSAGLNACSLMRPPGTYRVTLVVWDDVAHAASVERMVEIKPQ